MSEQAKSAALLSLVLLSIFLTYQLWFGRKGTDTLTENDYEAVYFEGPRPLSQLLVPERIIVYQKELCYRVRPGDEDFALLWDELSQMLQEIVEPANLEYGESLPEGTGLCLVLQFNPALPLGRESPWLKSAPVGELSEIQIWRHDDRCWGVLQNVEGPPGLLLLPAKGGEQLVALIDQFDSAGRSPYECLGPGRFQVAPDAVISLAAPIYVPARIAEMKELVLRAETLDHELLLKTFFIKRNLVREIKERDGGYIYTDGEQGLRLGEGLDYSHPSLEQKPTSISYPAALLTAGKLLGYYGGWPEGLQLDLLVRESETGAKDGSRGIYNAQWRSYMDGFPLLGGAGVAMSFYQGGLISYRRNLYHSLYTSGDQVIVRSYREALAAAVDLLSSAGVEQYNLEQMDLAYYLIKNTLPARAVPVWFIRLSGREVILKAGELIPLEGCEP